MKFTFAPESKPLAGFTIKRAIDRGGFGEVYYALSDSGKEVALKLLQQNMDVELRGVTQCLNLKHPNLVTIFDVKTDRDGDHWVVMEYVSGQGLDKALHQCPNGMPMEQVRYWLSGISEGLSYLHSRGLVHRDLKPSNVFRDGETIKIGDVGLSKFISHSRRSANTQSVGTVYYMAPEVARGRYGKEVDIYAVGVMVYEMITGVVPFDGESTAEILMKHLSEKPDLSRLPVHLRAVMGRALEKDPHKRIADIKVFKQEFERALFQRETVTEIPEDSFQTFAAVATPKHGDGMKQTSRVSNNQSSWEYTKLLGPAIILMFLLIGLMGATMASLGAGFPHFILGLPLMMLFCGAVVMTGAFGRLFFTKGIAAIVKGPPPISDLWDKEKHHPADTTDREYRAQVLEETRIFREQERQKAEAEQRRVREQHRNKRSYRRALTPRTPRSISPQCRLYDLSISMVKAVICTLVIMAGILCFTDGSISRGFWSGNDFAPLALLTFGSIVAAWSVLVVAKLTEGKSFDNSTRRIIWMVTGVFVGSLIYLIQADVLMASMPASREMHLGLRPWFNVIGPYSLILGDGQPSLIGYMVFFGMLFCFRRWWWHADSFRPRKFKVTSVLITVFVAYVITAIWAFPVVVALSWATIISCVVQLAASWIPEEQRVVEIKGTK
ncbi:serine/threonine protein kinase [Gimesia fumaroli]|uniref:Serine/threonine-protein kinase PrkC n=1 Tax=Gimesia fumaroli TaxID=2527976 RepID=A0A518IL30_9PLAN|nr:serine/threonine-protein kinase [Gimesia fumaroli]QDV53802.1 Serine/threonine-protein kinase PrkC [Gimesia fumaroli]